MPIRLRLDHFWPSRARRIAYQQRLLAMHRRLLQAQLAERALWPPSDVPPVLVQAIRGVREEIATCKGRLRGWHVQVLDEATDAAEDATFPQAVAQQRKLLAIHQEMLAILEQQYAQLPATAIPPYVLQDMQARHAAITDIRALLAGWNVPEESPIARHPTGYDES